MHHVYLLRSDQDGTFYIGFTTNLDRRLLEHNRGEVYFTKRKKLYRLIYYETFFDQIVAEKREKELKRFGSAYYGLLRRLGYYIGA